MQLEEKKPTWWVKIVQIQNLTKLSFWFRGDQELKHTIHTSKPNAFIFKKPINPLLPWAAFGEKNGNPLQYSCLGNPMEREAWQATVHT